jgi:hypothetical protein
MTKFVEWMLSAWTFGGCVSMWREMGGNFDLVWPPTAWGEGPSKVWEPTLMPRLAGLVAVLDLCVEVHLQC